MKKTMSYLAAALLLVAGLGVALYPQSTEWRYSFEQQALAAEAASSQATAAVDAGGQAMPKGAVAKIQIAKIGLSAYVVEGTDAAQLDKGPGHYKGTPLPGELGNSGIAGHRTMHGHVFRRLDEMKKGDEIVTVTPAKRSVYKVISVRVVDDSDWSVVDPTDDARLTLTTCHPVGSAKQRLVVTAVLVK
ncbi:MAG: class E sortase [Coriobacteriia bacterium]|nr:class E sortase [Coriobacteriia bacterium]